MIVQTTINNRPATAAFMNERFEPVDDENLATLVKVTFTDAAGGDLFLVPKAHSDTSTPPVPRTTTKARARAAVAYAVIGARAAAARRAFDPDEPRDESGKWTDGGGGGGDGGGGDGGKETAEEAAHNYGLVPGDVEKFHALKGEWAKVNNDLLKHVDKPDGPEARAAINKMEGLVKEMHALHADPGGPAGIGLPGGPRDVIVVGAGPGGLAASINGAAEGLDTLVIEANAVAGGQAKFSSRIENFGGFPIGVTGERLTQNMFEQAQRLGAEAMLGTRVTSMTYDAKTGLKHLTLSNGQHVDGRTVIMAGGLEFRRMEFPGAEGPGIVVGDGKELAKVGAGGRVAVIGGSNGAAQAALGCAPFCDHVYLLARSPIKDSMSDYQIAAIRNNPKITVIESDSIAKLFRDEHGNPQILETTKGQQLPVKAIGEFVGSIPATGWVPSEVTLAKGGRVQTSSDFETTLPGVYAVGDMREGAIGRIGVAYGEGQFALRQANSFLDKQREAAKPAKDYDPTTSSLVGRVFDLDRDNPWFGQTVEGVKPLPTPKRKTLDSSRVRAAVAYAVFSARARARAPTSAREKYSEDEPRDEGGRWTDGGGDSGDGGGGKEPKPTTAEGAATAQAAKVAAIVASVPGAKEAVAAAKEKLSAVGSRQTKPPDGNYPRERQELHLKILENLFTPDRIAAATPAPGEQPVVHLMGGAGGSGKSYFVRAGNVPTDKAVYINADDVKAALPEYQGWNSALVHEESSDVAKNAEHVARAHGLNVIVDGTMSSPTSLNARIEGYKDAGYRVEGHFMRVTPETSATRALQRFVNGGPTGRFVAPEMLLKHGAVENFNMYRDKMDKWEMYDNEGKAPVLVERSK